MNTIDSFKKIIESNNKFIITTHINPDGDAIGSSMALYYYLFELGKKVHVINYSSTPKYFKFLDPDNLILKFDNENSNLIADADVIFILDLNDMTRVKTMANHIQDSKAIKIVIDHHPPNFKFADYEFTDQTACSTGEILYRLMSQNGNVKLSEEIATALYTAMMTDTISFHLPTVTAEIYRVAANLIDWGANPSKIYFYVYEQNDISRFQLLTRVISSIKLIHNEKLVYMIVTQDMFRDTQTREQDIDNFIDYGMMIKNVLIVIFFVELQDGIKISFRSRGDIAINELAKKYNGNGHKNAAGARLFNTTLEQIVPDVLKNAEEYLP
jgi:phosphoesterase RecJ-like protein